ncbi:uncharacterized protein LOC142242515 [Haematobia irritans]|uniref:uncharacterized protein LOC142242515 n=1 Tax=Haematobia irritans TaxID=7368 RepID=UPI003F50C8F8
MESQFINAGISQDSTKYHTLVGSIESNILNAVSHIIENPPERDLYNSLKNALLAEFQDSEEKRLQKLMENVDLGDRKPSAMLRDMRQLASGKVSEEMLRSLWFQRLPATIKAVLSVSTDNLDKLSVMADKINDHLGNASINQLRTTQRNRSTSRKRREKSPSPSVTDEGELKICRLMLRDQSSKQQFLVDTGADVSVIPASLYGKRGEVEAFELQAANRTPIKTFGTKILKLNLGLRRDLVWPFVIADITQPIIGSDFLENFDLLVDIRRRCLIDKRTNLKVECSLSTIPQISSVTCNTLPQNSPFYSLISEFRDVARPSNKIPQV